MAGGVDLTGVLPQLRRDPPQSHAGVHLVLGLAGHALAALLLEDAVLADGEATPLGQLANADVVVLGPREVLERGAEGARLDDAEVDLEAVLVADRHLGVAAR